MLPFRLRLSKLKMKELSIALEKHRQLGDLKTMIRMQDLLSVASGHDVSTVSAIFQVSLQSVYHWINRYCCQGIFGLLPRQRAGRPSKLTKLDRKRWVKLIEAGPEANGFSGSCWRSPMIQTLVYENFSVFYSVKYIAELLKSLGFTYQKAKFVAANRDEEKRAADGANYTM